MPIDPTGLAKSIGTLTDPHPEQDLAALQEAVVAAKQLFDADAAGIMLADMEGSCAGPAPLISAPKSWKTTRSVRRRPLLRGVRYRPAGGHA